MLNNTIRIKLSRSLIGVRQKHREIVVGLGLKRINSVSELHDTPSIRGMIKKISYLIKYIDNQNAIK
ncbi:MAG TPA: 50S ribosomal protein L30 [Nitrosomonas sp.]|nr:50S ribosomal protein L30 [Nitrosomonas sp.]HMW20436.1 50S ribosomal protein L30 [Nitrosomonas sp.]HMW68130.1 50S ribosomal protein L30 [Nitrosomonas sp.]HMY60918.1 50S ribosomal protein L30 [Nitrosomonas sp.]HMY89860.1 50S ribosomal protein L30 [Nitrosomonas sp.]